MTGERREHGATCPECGRPLDRVRARTGGRCIHCGSILIYGDQGGLERKAFIWSYEVQAWFRIRYDYNTKWYAVDVMNRKSQKNNKRTKSHRGD